jgi:hypothetical protein
VVVAQHLDARVRGASEVADGQGLRLHEPDSDPSHSGRVKRQTPS